MRVVFISNYMNHHQLPFCRAVAEHDSVEFTFIATEPLESERLKLGYADLNDQDFVFCAYRSFETVEQAKKLCLECDVLLVGSASKEYYVQRLRAGKLTFRYNERIFKRGQWQAFSPRARVMVHQLHAQYSRFPVYLLCASAYATSDFYKMGAYRGKCFRWGYFPETKRYESVDEMIAAKWPNSLLWTGRFIEWKHPELAVNVAEKLKNEKFDFHLNMIGTGELVPKITQLIEEKGLSEYVSILGSMPPEQVRLYMEKSQIFLFTSDFHEGWGAVLNEAMNSACAVVASHAAGAVPYLVKNKQNGYIYKNGSFESLMQSVWLALKNDAARRDMQAEAYTTVSNMWNATIAAQRLLELCCALLAGQVPPDYQDGPCSRADVLKNNWFEGDK